MKNHEDIEIRDSINNALLRMAEWNSVGDNQDNAKSSTSRNSAYVLAQVNGKRYLEKLQGKSHLAHRLKSVKTFTRSSEFTKLVNLYSGLVYDLRTKDKHGEKVYCIVKIYKHKHPQFRSKMNGAGTFNLLDYGEVLYEGHGEPSSFLKVEMHKKFGMYEDSQPPDFEAEIIWEDGGEVRFIVALERENKHWLIVKIDPSFNEKYKLKVKEGKMNISDYGEILYSGQGDMPSSDMQEKIFKELGI